VLAFIGRALYGIGAES
jgi:hypothetical protein